MGSFFSLFNGGDSLDVKIDFNAEPAEHEKELCDRVSDILSKGEAHFKQLEEYKDCSQDIRRALSDPTPENETAAFSSVKVVSVTLKRFYEFSKELDELFCQLLKHLTADDEKSSIQEKQALSKKMAQIVDFVLKFDEMKIGKPGLQNDLSYYRRTVPKHLNEPDIVVRDDEASFILLFIAQPSPMMSVLSKSVAQVMKDKEARLNYSEQVPRVLSLMANICLSLVKSKQYDTTNTILCLRAMVGYIVLYDMVSAEGAFVDRSGIQIKQAVNLLVKEYPQFPSLTNALRYSTVHFKDETTPQSIVNLLENAA